MLNEDYYYLAKTLRNLCMSNTEKESMWDKYAIIEELKNPKSVLAYSVYFDKDKEFVNYMITLLGKEVSFYDKEFKEKNIALLNKIQKEL